MPTGQDIADFMGQGDDTELVAIANEHVAIVTAMAQAYTRGNGFTVAGPNEGISAVITTAAARLVANPEQLRYGVGAVQFNEGFRGWNLAETFTLNRFRKRAL